MRTATETCQVYGIHGIGPRGTPTSAPAQLMQHLKAEIFNSCKQHSDTPVKSSVTHNNNINSHHPVECIIKPTPQFSRTSLQLVFSVMAVHEIPTSHTTQKT